MFPLLPALLLGGGLIATAAIVTSRPILVQTDVRPITGRTQAEKDAAAAAKAAAANPAAPLLERWGVTTPAAPAAPKGKIRLFGGGKDGTTAPHLLGKGGLLAIKLKPRADGAAPKPLFGKREEGAAPKPLFGKLFGKHDKVGAVPAVVAMPAHFGRLGSALEAFAATARREHVPVDGPFVAPSGRVLGLSVDLDSADDQEGSVRLGLQTAKHLAQEYGIPAVGIENLGHGLYFYWFGAPGFTRSDVQAAIDGPRAAVPRPVVGYDLRQRVA